MYYHCRDLKHVSYGKVYPPPEDVVDFMLPMYKWLGHHCGYCPQVWLSRSASAITGFKNTYKKFTPILFVFDDIKGFHLRYDTWELIMNALLNEETFEGQNDSVVKLLNGLVADYVEAGDGLDEELEFWVRSRYNLDDFLRDYLFVEYDQLVVPSLNLKSAKQVICRNERQKKKLRKMGFIEDRIKIRNIK